MDPTSALSGAELGGLMGPLAVFGFVATRRIKQKYTLVEKYGLGVGLVIFLLFPDTATNYERIQERILHGSEDDALSFKQAVINECNMTAIAGAIITQVAITGLSLQNLSSTHWIARAAFLLSVVSGCLSVYYACVLQRAVGKLYRADRVKSWLSLPSTGGKGHSDASLAAIFIVSAPFTMVKVSIFSFLLGLTLYQGFMWTRELDPNAGPRDSRNVFIVHMIATGLCSMFFTITFAAKSVGNRKRDDVVVGVANVPTPQQPTDLEATGAVTERASAISRGQPVPADSHSADNMTSGDLAAALDAAAQAHLQCAKADRQVALEYSRAANNLPQKTE